MSGDQPVLEAREIDKWFGPVQALKKVSMSVYPGEIVALIGDNGAGKSTLINVLTGVFQPDGGQIFFQGQPVHFTSPHDARDMGIETVYQDLAIAPHLDAVANIYLGRELRMPGLLGWLGFLDRKRMREETIAQLQRLRVRIPDPLRRMNTLSGGQRQGVAVARAVMWASKVVIMDEPTAALGVAQAGMVLELIRNRRLYGRYEDRGRYRAGEHRVRQRRRREDRGACPGRANRRQGQGLRHQRQSRHLDNRSAPAGL